MKMLTNHNSKQQTVNLHFSVSSSPVRHATTDVPNISETSDNMCLWNVGAQRKHKNQIKGIRKEGTKKNLRTYQSKWWHMAN